MLKLKSCVFFILLIIVAFFNSSVAQDCEESKASQEEINKKFEALNKAFGVTQEDIERAKNRPSIYQEQLKAMTVYELYRKSTEEINKGYYSLAVKKLDVAIEKTTGSRIANVKFDYVPSLFTNRARAKFFKCELSEALIDASEAIYRANQLDWYPYSEMAYLHFNRGIIRRELGDKIKALADFSKGLEFNDRDKNLHFSRGVVLIEVGKKRSGCNALIKAGDLGHDKGYPTYRQYCN